jgi:endonuclease/exonuclease/phosphatase family metal-dependent hydrolase
MRIATFNMENLFRRTKAFSDGEQPEARRVLQAQGDINALLAQDVYSEGDKAEMLALLADLGLLHADASRYALLRVDRGHLLTRPRNGAPRIVASGRDAWIGWVELVRDPVDEAATRHTAMVVKDVGADVQACVEVEDRLTLKAFSESTLRRVDGTPFDHVMVIDGNDDRGIDVGVMTRGRYALRSIASHVDDADALGQIFSRDCAQYSVPVRRGTLVLLVNHLKSKLGAPAESDARRLRQATRVAQLYAGLRKTHRYVAVLGDFNDTIDSAPLRPLKDTDLRDISEHDRFAADGHVGTWRTARPQDKIDYILLSPALFERVTGGGVNRKGVHAGDWEHYDGLTEASAASDHAALFADLDL